MPTALIAPPTAGGVAGRAFSTGNVAGSAAVGRMRQASVPLPGERPVEDTGQIADRVAAAEEVRALGADAEAAVGAAGNRWTGCRSAG